MSHSSFVECIQKVNLSDKYKKNKSKILPLMQVLKTSVETMKSVSDDEGGRMYAGQRYVRNEICF